ncbi:unnamed protein product, partial [Nezara viridula]
MGINKYIHINIINLFYRDFSFLQKTINQKHWRETTEQKEKEKGWKCIEQLAFHVNSCHVLRNSHFVIFIFFPSLLSYRFPLFNGAERCPFNLILFCKFTCMICMIS